MTNPIWGEREYEYYQKLQTLQRKVTFDTSEFERTVDELKNCVTELLWRIAVEEAQLFQQLKLLKDFYLIGRGDFYLEFIKLTGHILNKTPTNHSSRDINLAFQMAMRKMHINDEAALDSFVFMVPVTEDSTSSQASNGSLVTPENTQVSTNGTESDRQDPIGKAH